MNEESVLSVLDELAKAGVRDICVCPGRRNSPFVGMLSDQKRFRCWWWYEERSAAFFAVGKSRATNRPVAVITTSGTAAGELLPAVMEAYYTGTPLIVITADRPRHMRGTGAPQAAEQVGLYGIYTSFALDLENEPCHLGNWDRNGPAHLNICLDEPLLADSRELPEMNEVPKEHRKPSLAECQKFEQFVLYIQNPVVIVSTLSVEDREPVVEFLIKMNAPVYLEGISGLREEPRLQHLRVSQIRISEIDSVLRIGGVPTLRAWRDFENMQDKLQILSISNVPFSGLSRGVLIQQSIGNFLQSVDIREFSTPQEWIDEDRAREVACLELMETYPLAEPSLMHQISNKIPNGSLVYLGNSMPIREWDLAATYESKQFNTVASRGLNGIDGQISTFLGMVEEGQENWIILGDLTALYDLAGPWILRQMSNYKIQFVVINNGGGQIFSKFYSQKEFLNSHNLDFTSMAKFWGIQDQLIELIPDSTQTQNFWEEYSNLNVRIAR